MKNICIVTVVDSISTTSMPTNEYVIYREHCNFGMRQVLIICMKEYKSDVEIPSSVEMHFVAHDIKRFRNTIKGVIKECKMRDEKVVFHLHAQTSALLFFLSTAFMGIYKQTVFTVHSLCSARNMKYRWGSFICALLANHVTCISQAVYDDYYGFIKKLKRGRMQVMVNAIDYNRLDEAIKDVPEHKEIADMKTMVCIDRMIPLKNHKFLIRLMKNLPDTKLILIGEEDTNGVVRQQAIKEGVIDRCDFMGILQREQVYREINKCGLYVTASTIEGLHNSVLEAMAVGTIPVISDIPAHKEIADTIGKIKTLEFDEQKWVKEIKRYQQMSTEETGELSDYVKNEVRNKFSLSEMHKKFNKVYEKIAQ